MPIEAFDTNSGTFPIVTFEASKTVCETVCKTDSNSSIMSQDQTSISKASSNDSVPNVMTSQDQSNVS